MRKNVRIMGKAVPVWMGIVALVAVASGAAAGTILAGKVTGEVPVAVSQALLVGQPTNTDPGDLTGDNDAPQQVRDNSKTPDLISVANRFIGVKSDDNTAFQAAAELAVGDWTEVQVPIKNASENDLYGLLTMDVPAGLEIEVYSDESTANVDIESVTRVGPNTWKFRALAAAEYDIDTLRVVISVDDDAAPGYYSMSGNIKQIAY